MQSESTRLREKETFPRLLKRGTFQPDGMKQDTVGMGDERCSQGSRNQEGRGRVCRLSFPKGQFLGV